MVKFSSSAILHANEDQVWAALHNPDILRAAIPGCESLEEGGEDSFRITLKVGVGTIRGVYSGVLTLKDDEAGDALSLKASAAGASGNVDADARVNLMPLTADTTRVEYDANADVGGTVGGVGQRVLNGVARRMSDEFFSQIDTRLAPSVGSRVAKEGVAPENQTADVSSAQDRIVLRGHSDMARGFVMGSAVSVLCIVAGAGIGIYITERVRRLYVGDSPVTRGSIY